MVLAGPSGAGKSTWANEWFSPSQVVSSDELRSAVGEHEHDLRASADSFAVLDLIVERRMARGLLTVIDSLGMDPDRNARWLGAASSHDRPTHLVTFDEETKVYRKRNNQRPSPVPSKVLTAQLAKWADTRATIGVAFDHQHEAGPVAVLAPALLGGAELSGAELGPAAAEQSTRLSFGLQVSAFDWAVGAESSDVIAEQLGRIVGEAEHAGFSSIWVMDHFIQIPQIGRSWEPMLEAYTTLGFLAARSTRLRLGTMVTCITHRNLAHLAKIVATLDVVSQGRAMCGLGVGWFKDEHELYGYRFPDIAQRYELLEDALQLLPLMWGPGTPPFEGRRFSVPAATCYPRPVQSRIPILVGGSGEKRTLAVVAKAADACNLFGEPEVIERKLDVLAQHCDAVGRDRSEIEITQLSAILAATDQSALNAKIDSLKPASLSAVDYAERSLAATNEHHVDRFGRLAAAGVDTVIVSLADVGQPGAVADFGSIIDAFRP